MKIDLDELERVSTAALDADFGFFGGDPVAAAHFVATGPRDTLALIARIRSLQAFIGATPDAVLQADKIYREDFPELFADEDGNALYMDEAKRRILARGTVLP